jgi:hypothetical protein
MKNMKNRKHLEASVIDRASFFDQKMDEKTNSTKMK